MRIAKSAEKRAEKGLSWAKVYFISDNAFRGSQRGFKSLRSNTDKQKQSMAVHYFEHRLRSIVFGAWISAAEQLRVEEKKLYKKLLTFLCILG